MHHLIKHVVNELLIAAEQHLVSTLIAPETNFDET
jgi:hypothetical protein